MVDQSPAHRGTVFPVSAMATGVVVSAIVPLAGVVGLTPDTPALLLASGGAILLGAICLGVSLFVHVQSHVENARLWREMDQAERTVGMARDEVRAVLARIELADPSSRMER